MTKIDWKKPIQVNFGGELFYEARVVAVDETGAWVTWGGLTKAAYYFGSSSLAPGGASVRNVPPKTETVEHIRWIYFYKTTNGSIANANGSWATEAEARKHFETTTVKYQGGVEIVCIREILFHTTEIVTG